MPPKRSRPAQGAGKRKPIQGHASNAKPTTSAPVPLDLQQLLLNIFKDSFAGRLESDIHPLLQEVKGHLYNRDFRTAFGREDYLEAYAARWSPSRALGYLQVLVELEEVKNILGSSGEHVQKVVCVGGGAGAEIVALGGFLNYQRLATNGESEKTSVKLDIVAIDIADWSSIDATLLQKIITPPPLSKYASAAAQAANMPLLEPEDFNVTFHQLDILNAGLSVLNPLLQGASLVTIMFTLNELYSTSISLTQKFLLNLTSCLPEGALLLVIDSPGSYSTVTLNGAEKKYPMQWLLDHTLLRQEPKSGAAPWTKLTEDESKWFRLDDAMSYPIELENMRFQLHLYKRTV
ncbi:uncharacterized protein EI97DRAFT_450203 [Westerdykella ornata]|uniref:25S rRNA (Uridine(2843)-N(3))-methyltransferase n=1 Tax=Westerdykella ornata TaxID=318751 RepID=A0A6A6JIS5_WESOR|nr:uncharacterized protein EI97DRAFT_450203 [Westerdykella ornata]KAF2276342.1 hypothetical protein EI97DRAFT_450203 [Westerdykella ornata]